LKVDYTHFINTLSPSEKLQQLKMLDQLNPALKLILEQELQSGNTILSVNKGWPEDDSVSVYLKKTFSKTYSHLDIEYEEINDPHYGKELYASKQYPKHLLISAV
jgi:hypothetical protein